MITVRSTSSNSSSSGSAISVPAPSGATVGDVVVVFVHGNGQTTIVDNNGGTPFTENVNDYQPNTSYGHTVSTFYRVIQSGDPSTYNFTLGSSNRWSIIALALQNVDTSNVLDTTSTTNNEETNDSTWVSPTITTVTANALHVAMACLDDATTTVTGFPSGYTDTVSASDQPMGVASKIITSPSATGTKTFTFSNSSARIGVSMAIRPAATSAPTVTTSSASSITTSQATGNGNVTSDGGSTVTERGFVLATTANPTTSDTKYIVSGTTGSYSGSMTSLSSSTTYHYRAYAINAIGTSYGSDQSFTTLSSGSAPTVTTTSVGTPTSSSNTASGDVTSDGGSTITERGIVISTSPTPTVSNTKFVATGTVGTFSVDLGGLSSSTTYYVRAYATNSVGTSYGSQLSFTTTSASNIHKHFYYKVYQKSGVGYSYYTTWSKEVLSDPSITTNINTIAGELSIRLARSFDNFGEDADVRLNNKVECYVVDKESPNGLLIYSGYISGYTPVISEVEEYLDITVFSFGAKLSRMILRDVSGNTTVTYNSYDPSNILKDVIDNYRRLGGELNYSSSSVDITNTTVSYTFNTNTIKECLDKIIELCPVGWYYRVEADGLIYLKPKHDTADHTLTVGINVEKLTTYRRIEDIVNRVLFTGNGIFRKYENTSSQDLYGIQEVKIVDERVTNVSTAQIMSEREINTKKDPEIRSNILIVDSNGADNRGYNIESIKVGHTIEIKNLRVSGGGRSLWDVSQWDVNVWDQTLASSSTDVIQIMSINYYPDYIEIEASSRLPQISKRIEDINRNLQNSQTASNPVAPS